MALGAVVFALGVLRVLLVSDALRRVVAINVASIGVLIILIALAARPGTDAPDPLLHALALTGIVITISISGVALVLIRHIESRDDDDGSQQ